MTLGCSSPPSPNAWTSGCSEFAGGEALQDRQAPVGGAPYPWPAPSFVLAPQTPVELEGTSPLPGPPLARFILRGRMGYPPKEDEERILSGGRARRSPAWSAL